MRLIDADALIKFLGTPEDWRDEAINKIINNTPSADAAPVMRGEWMGVTHGRGGHECSKCRGYAPSFQNGVEYLSSYCPNCGAKIEDKSCG